MDVVEIRMKRKELESTMLHLIRNFEDETATIVGSVDIDTIRSMGTSRDLIGVKVEVTIKR